MSSGKGDGKPFSAGISDPSTKGKSISEVSSHGVDQLGHGVADMNLDSSTQDDGWEVYARKSKNRASAKPWGAQNPNNKAWGDYSGRLGGRGGARNQSSNRGFENDYRAPPAASVPISPPLEHGWNWQSPALGQSSKDGRAEKESIKSNPYPVEVDESDDDGEIDESDDDDELLSDEFDSDCSQKSHETRKKSRWFKAFFEVFDGLTVEEINEPARQWHCPACQDGPGAIEWFRGLQPLVTHAKTKGSKRVKPHRELAELLDEELRRRGTTVVPAGEAFGKWKGLDDVKDKEIVWPPMVVIMNTRLEKDENDEKWKGMGTPELLDYFSLYDAKKAKHSYGPQGHRGMSILVCEASAVGYLEAERLSKHFEDQGTNREAWDRHRVPFLPGGQRQLYGYMAEKGDLDIFNLHSPGKSKLKFDMRSYQEMVVSQMKQMSEDNQQLMWFKNKVAKEQRHSKALEETCGLMSEKLRKTLEENRIVRQRTKMHHEQNKEEMDYQEQFFKDQIEIIRNAREAKEDNFEKIQQEEREKVKQSCANPSSTKDHCSRDEEEVAKFIKIQDKEMKEFVEEREKVEKMHEEKRAAMKRRHWEETVELEKEFDVEFTLLMERYTPGTRQQSTSSISSSNGP